MREVIFDIETQDAAGADLRRLRLSVVGAYTTEDDRFYVFREENLRDFWALLERAERVVGFNSLGFDVPVLKNYYAGDLEGLPHLDMLEHVKRAVGFRVKLDDLAQATLGIHKTGHGLQAVEWFKQGEWEKIEKYCLDDVRITRDLYEFGKKNRQLYYTDLSGNIRPVPVNFDPPRAANTDAKINLTLPL